MNREVLRSLEVRELTAFRGASFRRAAVETALGSFALSGVAHVVDTGPLSWAHTFFAVAAALWLLLWPAWRLSTVPPDGWSSRVLGGAHSLLFAAVIALLGDITAIASGTRLFALACAFLLLRILAAAAATLMRRARHHLRWQLLLSHVGVILLMVIALTSLGSAIGVALVDRGLAPDPAATARSIAESLRLAGGSKPMDRSRVENVFNAVYHRKLLLGGEPVLSALAPAPFLPHSIALVDTNGRVILGDGLVRNTESGTESLRAGSSFPGVNANLWLTLRTTTLRYGSSNLSVDMPNHSPLRLGASVLPSGHGNEFVVVDMPGASLTTTQYLHAVLAFFGVSTVAIILLISIPMLALSFAFSFFVARRITRRLESVSSVAASLADGELDRRVSVRTEDEVGQLARDVNEMADNLQAAVAELQEAESVAVESLRERRELVANVSHELRTPLAVLMAHLELALSQAGASEPSASRLEVPAVTMRALKREAQRLQSLIEDLFALSRSEAGEIGLRLEEIDCGELVEDVVELMGPLAGAEGSVSVTSSRVDEAPTILADRDRLKQVLANLVRNAVRHTPEGGIIAVSTYERDGRAVIEVSDTGTGIPPDDLPHIFERFYRVTEDGASSGGAGLGLSIVRELVELMGGEVTVESVQGEGTHFYVSFPATPMGLRSGDRAAIASG